MQRAGTGPHWMVALLVAIAVVVAGCGTADDSAGARESTGTEPPVTATEPDLPVTATDGPPEPSVLDGTEWLLTSIGEAPVADGFVVRFQFVNGNQVGGFVACDGFGFEYSIDGTSFVLTEEVQRTTFGCQLAEDPEQQGASVFEALASIDTFEMSDASLEFYGGGGASLLAFSRFLPPPLDPLLAGEWVVVELNGARPLEGTHLALEISLDGVGGFGGCNGFGGPRSPLASNALAVEEIAQEAQGCLEPAGIIEQEDFYMSAVGDAAAYRVTDDALELLDAGGSVIVKFSREPEFDMNPADLIGTEWLLSVFGDRVLLPDTEITLTFTSASEVAGNAGCRSYTGTYLAEGDDITLTSLGMTTTECPRSEAYQIQEAEFTTALSTTRRYLLDGDQLQLWTRTGQLLVFGRVGG